MNRQPIEALESRTRLRWMVAQLDGYALQFNKRSTVDQSGKALVKNSDGVKLIPAPQISHRVVRRD
jgi:hypothetical protein